MAIAYDASSLEQDNTSLTEQTLSHTCGSGGYRILFVGVVSNASSGADVVTGVTYNGVAMTRINTIAAGDGNERLYLYYLLNPAAGANDIVVSASASGRLYVAGVSYTGAKQANQPDANDTSTTASNTTLSSTVTTVADNAWTIMFARNNASEVTSTDDIRVGSGGTWAVIDSNAALSPGSHSLQSGGAPAQGITQVMCSFAPFTTEGFLGIL